MIVEHRQAVVVGSGLAGMAAALSLDPLDTLVITKTSELIGGSTPWAQGGMAVARDDRDLPLHLHDTVVSGAGHTNPQAARFLVDQGPAAREWLEAQGVKFDRNESGDYLWGQEGAHTGRRILHAGADGTGAAFAAVVAGRLGQTSHITTRCRTMAVRMMPGALLTFEEDRGPVLVVSPRIILAGGGLGQLFEATTAPAESTGDTIALALEAGAVGSDLEMVQFHPTALAVRAQNAPSLALLTEALRGEGAILVTANTPEDPNVVPLDTGHPLGSLGPRDVLSRAIFHRQTAGFPVWLDARRVASVALRFPTVTRLCAQVGLNPAVDLLPVTPAVHYTMGGIVTDLQGRTSLSGVWAAGETARTGVHGANRLASNSLLECVVFGRSAGHDAGTTMDFLASMDPDKASALAQGWSAWKLPPSRLAADLRGKIAVIMSRAAGPVRRASDLEEGLRRLETLQGLWDRASTQGEPWGTLSLAEIRSIFETRHLLILGPAVLRQALARKVSLGAHYREDCHE